MGSVAEGHALQALALQASLSARPTTHLLDEQGSDDVLQLARAQTCVASYTRSEALATATAQMLGEYTKLHELHGSAPPPTFEYRAMKLVQDAEHAGQGKLSPDALGCDSAEVLDYSTRRFSVRRARRIPKRSMETMWSAHFGRGMHGGVIR